MPPRHGRAGVTDNDVPGVGANGLEATSRRTRHLSSDSWLSVAAMDCHDHAPGLSLIEERTGQEIELANIPGRRVHHRRSLMIGGS
jgi:hypothetical protein